jgi:hypothetical protein
MIVGFMLIIPWRIFIILADYYFVRVLCSIDISVNLILQINYSKATKFSHCSTTMHKLIVYWKAEQINYWKKFKTAPNW